MSDRKPREFTIVRRANHEGGGYHVVESTLGAPMTAPLLRGGEAVRVREVLGGDWEDLAAAIDRIGEDEIVERMLDALADADHLGPWRPSLASQEIRVAVRALRGAGEKEAPDG